MVVREAVCVASLKPSRSDTQLKIGVASTLTSHNGVSVDTDDSASEYGISESESNKSDVNAEVENDSDISDLLSKTPENLQEVLMKEVHENSSLSW